MASLSRQAREHLFERRYRALVRGKFSEDRGVIRASIGRSLSDRGRMAVTGVKSREAVTHFTVLEQFGVAASIALQLETGRTHQIRVHLRFAGRPVLGDPVYGVTDFSAWDIPPKLRAALEGLHGQALHAELLGIEHPRTGERMRFESPLPADFQRALDALREYGGAGLL
ncbi:MAG: pseudouridine synthase [Phycisphaeraceae bacterium]